MRELFMTMEFRVTLALLIAGLCLFVTLDAVLRSIDSQCRSESDGEEPFLNENGDHVYYDRSIIRKEDFLRKNPKVVQSQLRTFRRLLAEILSRDC